jgi:hypothetical protein
MQNFDHNIGFREKSHFFAENCQKSQKVVITTLGFEKTPFFRRKLSKIAENRDHNIGFREKRQFFRRKLSKVAENRDHNIKHGRTA